MGVSQVSEGGASRRSLKEIKPQGFPSYPKGVGIFTDERVFCCRVLHRTFNGLSAPQTDKEPLIHTFRKQGSTGVLLSSS